MVQLGCLQKDNANSVRINLLIAALVINRPGSLKKQARSQVVTEPAVALPLSRLATPAVPPAASAAAAAFPERACAAVGSEEWKEG